MSPPPRHRPPRRRRPTEPPLTHPHELPLGFMSISPRERTGGSYYPRAPNPTPSPQHGSQRRRHGRRSPPATVSPPAAAAAPGAGGSGASSGEFFLPAQLTSLSRSPAPADGLSGEVGSRFCWVVWEPPTLLGVWFDDVPLSGWCRPCVDWAEAWREFLPPSKASLLFLFAY